MAEAKNQQPEQVPVEPVVMQTAERGRWQAEREKINRIQNLREQLEAAISVTNTALQIVVNGEQPLSWGIERVRLLMSFRRRLVEECKRPIDEVDRRIDWATVAAWASKMQQHCSA